MTVWESIDYVSQWTRDSRERLGWTQTELASRASELKAAAGSPKPISQQIVDQFERKTHKGVPEWFRYIRAALEEAMEGKREVARPKPRPLEPELPPALPDDIELIREVDIRLAMGDGRMMEEYPETGIIPFNRNFRRALTQADASQLFVARGDGDSMMPTLINDDMVLIDTTQRDIRQTDRIWALRIEDAGFIKRVRVVPGGGYELISDNPMIPPQAVAREHVSVIGRVVWIGRRM